MTGIIRRTFAALFRLYIAAKCIEHYLPGKLRSDDIIIDTWFMKTTSQIATALREKKIWILTPKSDTYKNFVERIASILTCIVEGHWDELEKIAPEKLLELEHLSPSQLWRSRLMAGLKMLLVAVLPLLVFVIWQLVPSLAPTGPFHDYLVLFLILWTLSTLITAIDPRFSLSTAFKDTISPIAASWKH